MKYCASWKHELRKLPKELQDKCIDYKVWKKYIYNGQDIYSSLDAICTNIDKVLQKYSGKKQDLLFFAKINKLTLYKLSKRLSKKYEINVLDWYYNSRSKYIFCGFGYFLKSIELKISTEIECPICLDVNKKILVTNCGHYFCATCTKKLYKVDNLNGKLSNLISFSVYQNHFIPKCPICRKLMPLNIKSEQIVKT